MHLRHVFLTLLTSFSLTPLAGADTPALETLPVWPGTPPGVTPEGPEIRLEGRPRPFYQVTGIAVPVVEVYAPSPAKRLGAALLVCPGGGLQRLAYEHEGLEVAQWATERGITAFVLKYRVPAPVESGLADAQRALSLIRGQAAKWEIDPTSIGVIGFSAGGEIAAWMATHASQRQYEAIDKWDAVSCRPDYAVLVYPGGLTSRNSESGLKDALAKNIAKDNPPMFFAHASQDSCENSLLYALALKREGIPVELHVYYDGGHGFGMRPSGSPLGMWHSSLEHWLGSLGHLDDATTRRYASAWIRALPGSGPLPNFPVDGSLQQALAVQRRLIAANGDTVIAFKAAATSAAAQAELGLTHPLAGALFKSGLVPVSANAFTVDQRPGMLIETEIGYRVAVDIAYDVLTADQARDAVEAMLPVIEMPLNYAKRLGVEKPTATQLAATNIGSDRYAFGESKSPSTIEQVDALNARLTLDDQAIHEVGVATLKDGQWESLRQTMNQITRQGQTIHAGSVILSGALGKPYPVEPGHYEADYGPLGKLSFEVTE